MKITLKTFFGLEDVLIEELTEFGYTDCVKLNRAVQLNGTWEDVYFLNLNIRCALSVLVEITTFTIKTEKDIYTESKKINWSEWFDVHKTFAIKGAVNSSIFKHSQYPYLLVKDAVVDHFRDKTGERPDINIKTPHLVIDLYVREQNVTLSLNTSGLPLFQRGYRQATGEAPLNEVVAAALLRMAKWDRKTPLVDPFCGSGTLLIEAALWACNIPSNIERTHYAFKNLKNFDAKIWEAIIKKSTQNSIALPCKICGGDSDSQMVLKARRNLRGFSFGRFIEVTNTDFREFNYPNEPSLLISNPPYGERLTANIESLYGDLGSLMKHQLLGYTCCIISSNEEGFKSIGLRHAKKFKLYNGDLECSFRTYTIYEGSKKNT